MNSVFWIGIGIGFVLSLIASMVTNIYNEKIPLLLGGKLISKRRCRKKLGQDYKLVSEPYSDKRDKYLSRILLRIGSSSQLFGPRRGSRGRFRRCDQVKPERGGTPC